MNVWKVDKKSQVYIFYTSKIKRMISKPRLSFFYSIYKLRLKHDCFQNFNFDQVNVKKNKLSNDIF